MNLTKQVSFTKCFWRYLGACISFDAQLEGRTQQNHCRSAIISRNDCRFVFKRQNENDYRSAIIVGASGPINRYQSAAEWMNWTKHVSSTKCSWRDLDVCISSYTQLEGRTQKNDCRSAIVSRHDCRSAIIENACKSNEIQWNPKGYPLQNGRISIAIQWNPEGYPLQNARKSSEIQWNPKGYPFQNARKSIGILRGTPCKLTQNHWHSMKS